MKTPDWGNLILGEGVLCETVREGNRIVFWLPASRDQAFQYWERIGTVPRAEIKVEHGICTTPATSVQTRQRLDKGLLGKLARKLTGSANKESWTLPTGQPVEKCGELKTGLLLAWPEAADAALDEDSLRAQRPGMTRFQSIGTRVFLIADLASAKPDARIAPAAVGVSGTEELGCPIALAEQLLEAARQSGDRSREAAALVDLGIIVMNEGDPKKAVAHLEKAVQLSRQISEKARELDALNNLGYALLYAGQPSVARQVLEAGLGLARQLGDPYAEKLIMERLGSSHVNMSDPLGALSLFDRALEMTRSAGDRQQETRILWSQAIAHADINQRDQAIGKAEESIDLLRKMGKPEAAWYGAQLQRYRMDFAGLVGNGPGGFGSTVVTSGPMGGSVMTATPAVNDPASGPGLLRMAVSATKAMMRFIGSGLKTTAPDLQQKRLATCQACEHHTGLRCRICGCFTNVKTRMAHEQCPISKWPG